MIDKFTKSLGFLGVNASNMNHVLDEKNMFKFEDKNIDKHWRCFYAFYKMGWNDASNEMTAFAVRGLKG